MTLAITQGRTAATTQSRSLHTSLRLLRATQPRRDHVHVKGPLLQATIAGDHIDLTPGVHLLMRGEKEPILGNGTAVMRKRPDATDLEVDQLDLKEENILPVTVQPLALNLDH